MEKTRRRQEDEKKELERMEERKKKSLPHPTEGVWVCVHEQEDRCQQGPDESEQI